MGPMGRKNFMTPLKRTTMELPRVKIQFLNGQLGTVGESSDGLMALMCGAVAVAATFALGTPYEVTSMDDVADLGVTAENNATLYKHLKEYYDEAESGTKVVVYGVSATATASQLCDYTNTSTGLRDLIVKENGALRGVGICNVTNADMTTTLQKAQQTAEWATTELYAPLFVALEAKNYTGSADLTDLTTLEYDRCCVVAGDTEAGTKGACVGTLLGRVASIGVQVNIGRVKDGALEPTAMWLGDKKIDESQSAVSAVHGKGYMVPRKHVGRSGYYWADDPMATKETEDYAHLANRRVIDKAYRIAYDTLLDLLLDDVECNTDGTLQTAVAKSWQQTVENAINRQMTASGELSTDEDGSGVEVYVDETQNVIATSKVNVTVKVQPKGYARQVDVKLGFNVSNA